MGESKKWVLIANYSDKTLLRNYYVSKIGNSLFLNQKWNPSFMFVDFVLNNEYMGTYIIGEQIKIDENRVNIQKVSDVFDSNCEPIDVNMDGFVDINDGGFIFEINTNRMDEAFNYRTTLCGIGMSLKDPDVDDFLGHEDVVEDYMSTIIQNTENILYSDSWLDEITGYRNYIDVPSFIDWWFVNEFTKNNDACWFSSVYIYYNPITQKIYMGPNWDFDISCGNINYNGCDNYNYYWIKNSGWHARLFSDPEFINDVKQRWLEIKDSLYASIDEIQEYANYLEKSAKLNFIRWPILGNYVWPNSAGYEIRTTYQSEIDYMIDWLKNRYTWMDAAIDLL